MKERAQQRVPAKPDRLAENVPPPNLAIVDRQWCVVMSCATDVWEAAGLTLEVGRPVPLALQQIVETELDARKIDRTQAFCVRIAPWPQIALTIYAAIGAREPLIGLTAQTYRARKNLVYAQRAYRFSPRELEILRHVLRGSGTSQIAFELNIADSTVVAHIKSLLGKTKAANRAALVARVLGWEEPS